MNNSKLQDDLAYVKRAVDRSEGASTAPLAIYLLWSAISLVGFSMPDFFPQHTGLYWMIAAPGGFVVSFVLGHLSAKNMGERDRRFGLKIAAHWALILLAFVLIIPLAMAGRITGKGVGQIMVLISGVGYLFFGLHVDRRFLFPGLIILLGYGVILWLDSYAWTIAGVAIGLSMAATGLIAHRGEARE